MSGNQSNFRRNGNGGGQKRFNRGGFGRNNRGANQQRKGDNFQRYGNSEDYNRPFTNTNTNANTNTNTNRGPNNDRGPAVPFHEEGDGFSKFRDLEHQEQERQRYDNARQRRNSGHGGRGRGRNNWNGGRNSRENAFNGHEENMAGPNVTKPAEAEILAAAPVAAPPPLMQAAAVSATAATLPPQTGTTTPQTQNVFVDKKPILSKIKLEKVEPKEVKRSTKPPPARSPSPSSSSSGSSESSDTNPKENIRNKAPAANPKNKSNQMKVEKAKKAASSSTSSSEEESSDEEEPAYETPQKSKLAKELMRKIKKMPRKQSSEEDLVCLGKLEKKFIIEDDEYEGIALKEKSKASKSPCLICDKPGHTAFECQMICKNCSAQYHNLKTCPKPANLTVMMQSFMQFCMSQLNQFNPEQRFSLPQNLCLNENVAESPNRKAKDVPPTPKGSTKTAAKRKRARTVSRDCEEDEEEEDDETAEESSGSESKSESDSAEALPISSKKKKKSIKTTKTNDFTELRNTFTPPQFTTFPTFGAAAAAYNPLLFGQLMQSAFPAASTINYK